MKFEKRNAQKYLRSFAKADRLTFLQSGETFFKELIVQIERAQSTISIQTYKLDDEITGQKIADALIKAVKRGVDVDLVVDGFGSIELSSDFEKYLTENGIQFRFFSKISLFKNLRIGRRLHHKIAVFDQQAALVGGINLATKYEGTEYHKPWLDFGVLIEGSICKQFEKICFLIEEKAFVGMPKRLAGIPTNLSAIHINIRQNDWLRKRSQILRSYLMAVQNSEKSIILFASYFLPGFRLRKALENAAKRGVHIKVVLSGISDIPFFHNASKYLYKWLQKNQIKVYEWTPTVLHAKLAVIDGEWMTIGSFNLNHLSAYASIELNVDILSKPFVHDVTQKLKQLIENGCNEIVYDPNTRWFVKTKQATAYYLGRVLMNWITFFPNIRNYYSKMVD